MSDYDDVVVGAMGLTPGATYYISVDSYSGYYGSFTLCLQSTLDYDFYEGAIDVTTVINGCSTEAAYTTIGGTPDRNAGSNWNNAGPKYNRWFKFTAPATGQMNITVDTYGSKGSQRRTQLALWQADGTTEVSSNKYVSDYDDVVLSGVGLTPGATYYISVDAYSGYAGSFTLCLEQSFIDFNGSNYYVDFGNNQNFTGSFSLEAWVFQKSSSSIATIISKGDMKTGALRGYHLTIKNGFPNISWYNNSGVAILNITSPHQLTNNIWHHIASTYNGTKASLYLDGILVASSNSSPPLSNSQNFMLGASYDSSTPTVPKNYFNGYIDEVRVWNVALSAQQLHEMMNQEIVQNGTSVGGKVIPLAISEGLLWSNLKGYYPMTDNTAADKSSYKINGYSKNNTSSIQLQTAPLPYTSTANGDWETATTWFNNSVQYTPNSSLYGSPVNWNIVKLNHTISSNTGHTVMGLIINSPSILTVKASDSLRVSKYLKLDGKINLEGESQLVQGTGSELDPTSSGTLQRDQQGTADTYTYNYWSSPVGIPNNTTNNSSYTLPDIFQGVNFLSSGYNGKASPLGIADYWIWKFSNKTSGDYSQWQHVRSTGTILAGEGFTMKGPGTGSISTPQNYVLLGKPNNGDIYLTISAGNDYLVGNPYPSALDADQFILDNGSTIAGIAGPGSTNGTLYFWEHWGGGSHNLREYQGGYATYSLSGGVPAASMGTNDPDVGTGGTPTKIPGRYIPVAQGFFVTAETSGSIKFNNGQRAFQIEDGTNSVFVKSSNTKNAKTSNTKNKDTREKIRIGFNSVNTIRRQLLITADSKASIGYDWGYDAPYIDELKDDMYWLIDSSKYTIQGIDKITERTILPLGIHTKNKGLNSITIDKIENAPNNLKIYLHDKQLNLYHDLKQSNYEVYLEAGEYLNRFEVTFSNSQTLGTEDPSIIDTPIHVYFLNEKKNIVIDNPGSKYIESIEMFNFLGQFMFKFEPETNKNHLEYNVSQIRTGVYIFKIKTEFGKISKKVIIK